MFDFDEKRMEELYESGKMNKLFELMKEVFDEIFGSSEEFRKQFDKHEH